MERNQTLEDKYNLIKQEIGENVIIYFNDIQQLFPDKKKTTLYWDVSKLVDEGYLLRVRNGVYRLNENRNSVSLLISSIAKKAIAILEETGFNFYVSGVDILAKYLHHIPETYPIIMFIEKYSMDEIYKVLADKSFHVVKSAKALTDYESMNFTDSRSTIILIETESFTFAKDHYATMEKAFLDLYYEITRNGYPLAIQELVRVYQNIVRNGAIDQKKLIKAAYVRNMQYDIRFIVESKYITDSAIKFVETLKRTD